MSYFKPFYFEGNLYYGYITCYSDLQRIYDAYVGHMTSDEILDDAMNAPTYYRYGFKREHSGKTSLRMHLR